MSNKLSTSPTFFKDVDILYEGAGLFNEINTKIYHSFFRIIYFDNTSALLLYEGIPYHIKPNQTIVIKPNTVYEIKSDSIGIKYFDFNFLDKKSIYNIDLLFKSQFIFEADIDSFYRQCFNKSLEEAKQQLTSKILLQSGIGFCLLSMIFRQLNNTATNQVSTKQVSRNNIFLLSEIETKLNEDFINNSIINNLAYAVGISENKLYKVIKDTYDLSPKQWILQIKIKKIKIMLVERKTYHEITELLAFCSISHMSSTFKKYVGYTPNEYLKNYSNK